MDIESETEIINEHVDKGNFHAAINLAISAMNQSRRENDQSGVDYFINMIKAIVTKIEKTFGSSC